MTQNKSRLKEAISITVTVLAVLIFVCAVFVFALTLYAKSNGKQPVLFGYSFSVVVSDSMTPEIQVGELVTVKHCSLDSVKIGDNAVYIAQSGEREGDRIIHKVEIKGVDEHGNAFIRTRGVKQGAPLDEPIYAYAFVGIGVAHSVFLGKLVLFFSNTVNWVCLLVFLVGIWLGVRQIRKLVSYAKEEEPTAENGTEHAADKTDSLAENVMQVARNEEKESEQRDLKTEKHENDDVEKN